MGTNACHETTTHNRLEMMTHFTDSLWLVSVNLRLGSSKDPPSRKFTLSVLAIKHTVLSFPLYSLYPGLAFGDSVNGLINLAGEWVREVFRHFRKLFFH